MIQQEWQVEEGKSRERPEASWKSEVMGCTNPKPCSECERILWNRNWVEDRMIKHLDRKLHKDEVETEDEQYAEEEEGDNKIPEEGGDTDGE